MKYRDPLPPLDTLPRVCTFYRSMLRRAPAIAVGSWQHVGLALDPKFFPRVFLLNDVSNEGFSNPSYSTSMAEGVSLSIIAVLFHAK